MLQNASLPSRGVITAVDGGKLCNQADGNLVLYGAGGGVKWATSTNDHQARTLTLDTYGRLILTSGTNTTYVNPPGPAGTYYLKVLNGTLGVYNSADDTVHEMIYPVTGRLDEYPR